MQITSSTAFATSMADAMVSARFGKDYGIHTYADYLDLVERRATVHLDAHMADRVRATAGEQRRRAHLSIENSVAVIIAVPLNDPRTGETIWVELDFAGWLDAIERGADSAWFFAYKAKDRRDGQVRTHVALSGQQSTTNATLARTITNAKVGQQARTLDRNPLNLRRSNLFLVGNPNTVEGRAGRAKTDTVAQLQDQAALRQSMAGRKFGIAGEGEK